MHGPAPAPKATSWTKQGVLSAIADIQIPQLLLAYGRWLGYLAE